jgi:protein-S-isoprenylcysteine O-methyltransferase Ste14
MTEPVRSVVKLDLIFFRELGANILLAGLFLLFAWANLYSFSIHHRYSLIFMVILETITAVLFLFRSRPDRVSFAPYSWLITTIGTFAPFLFRPSAAVKDLPVGQFMQVLGITAALFALLSLWRSFGMLPATRGVRSHGAYHFVRHPIYAAYFIQHTGYLINNLSAANIIVFLVWMLCQVLRIFDEEKLLSTVPDYREYMKHTRWRLVPFVF